MVMGGGPIFKSCCRRYGGGAMIELWDCEQDNQQFLDWKHSL